VAPAGPVAAPAYHVIKSEFFGRPLPAEAIAEAALSPQIPVGIPLNLLHQAETVAG